MKQDILRRLLEERHITVEELFILMEKEIVYISVPQSIYPVPVYPTYPIYPTYYPQLPTVEYTTCKSD